jgi:phosphosulfolactate synthase
MTAHTYPYLTLPERQGKPRTVGLTMVHDSGYGAKQFELILETAAPYIDYYKLRTFTHALYDEAMTRRKLALAKENGIKLFMGGNVAEFASVQGKLEEHLSYTKELGWDAIEISETYVTYEPAQKLDLIKRCADDGLEVIYEWGLKKPSKPLDPADAAEDIKRYLDAGVHIAIVEEGEIDMLIGKDGDGPHGDRLKELFDRVGPEHLMVECGTIKQTAWFMLEMGTVINIGNVELDDIKDIEPLRRGIGRPVDNAIYRPYLDK